MTSWSKIIIPNTNTYLFRALKIHVFFSEMWSQQKKRKKGWRGWFAYQSQSSPLNRSSLPWFSFSQFTHTQTSRLCRYWHSPGHLFRKGTTSFFDHDLVQKIFFPAFFRCKYSSKLNRYLPPFIPALRTMRSNIKILGTVATLASMAMCVPMETIKREVANFGTLVSCFPQ